MVSTSCLSLVVFTNILFVVCQLKPGRLCKLIWTLCLLIFLFAQAIFVIKYYAAQQLNQQKLYYAALNADLLLSQENVSASVISNRKTITELNQLQIIYNHQIFGGFNGSSIDPQAPVFVTQVHDRVQYLEALIGSLKDVRGIEEALLVFSHDYFSDEINNLVRNITFARVMQIYYPYSVQLYPVGFPGPDPSDVNLLPGYGRTPQLSQIKLHWVWKLTQAFRDVQVLANHSGPKIFLEEDHFILPDALHVVSKLLKVKESRCPACLVVIGGYPQENTWQYSDLEWDFVLLEEFFSSGNNIGMVLDKSFWNMFLRCSFQFCTTDDYNWDWTIQHLNKRCFPSRLQVLEPDVPRVWHVGICGTHTKSEKKCRPDTQMNSVENLKKLVQYKEMSLFPETFRVVDHLHESMPKTPDPFGGWGDPRDRDLCLIITKTKSFDF